MEGKQPLQVSMLMPQLNSPSHHPMMHGSIGGGLTHHHYSAPNITFGGSTLNLSSSKQVLNRLEVLPNQFGQHRLTPSTLVVKKVNAKTKGGLTLNIKKSSLNDGSFAMDDDPKKQSIPSFFPSTLRPRQGSAPSKTRKDDSSVSGSCTSRKTIKSTPRQIVDEFLEDEIQKKSKHEQSGVFEKQLECLLMDNDINAARQSIKDAYLFKSYERDTSKFSRKIELSQLGITLILHNKENFYNFYSRFKDSNTSLLEETMSDVTESKGEADESSPTFENHSETNEDNNLSIEPFITDEEKLQIVNVLENTGEPYLLELFKSKYKRDIKSMYNSFDPLLSRQQKKK